MKQTTFGSPADDQTDDQSETSTEDTEQSRNRHTTSPASTASSDGEEDITSHRPSGVDKWLVARDADGLGYAVLQVKAKTKRTLQDVHGVVCYEARTKCSDYGWVTPGARYSSATDGNAGVAEYVARWTAETVATPHAPVARPFPAENVQVFAADVAVDLATKPDVLREVIATANTVDDPSLPSDDDFLELIDEYRRLDEMLARDGELRTRRKDVEQTMRAKIGWTSKYDHEVPDQVVAFSSWSLGQEPTPKGVGLSVDSRSGHEMWQANIRGSRSQSLTSGPPDSWPVQHQT